MKNSKILISFSATLLMLTASSLAAQATSTYTQGWSASVLATQPNVITATSSTPWSSVAAGSNLLTRMSFESNSGVQTVRLNLSLVDTSDNNAPLDVSLLDCGMISGDSPAAFVLSVGTGTSQVSVTQVSRDSSQVVCDVTFSAAAVTVGISLVSGVSGSTWSDQEGYIGITRAVGSGLTTNLGDIATPAPSYTGPKISSFNLGSVAPGGSLVASGKKLDQIQSATIGGKAASLSYSSVGLTIGVPEDLTPGIYDLVMQTSYGKLTQINAVVVKTKPKLSSFTLRGIGSSISADLAAEIKAVGAMYSADYSKIHCVVNSTDEAAAAIAAEACSLLKTGSLSSATTLTSLKSTFKGSGFWLRVYLAG